MGSKKLSKELESINSILLLGTTWDVISRYEIENQLIDKEIYSIGQSKHHLFCKNYNHFNRNSTDYIENFYEPRKEKKPKRPITKQDEKYNWSGILNTLNEFLEDDADIFVDAGNTGAQCVSALKPRGLGQFFISLGQGGMGNSYGAAIGCSTATKKRSYIFSGDGSFLINGLELHTAVENDLPLCVFIFNNNSHGMCKVREDLFLNGSSNMNKFKDSSYAKGLKTMFNSIESFEVNSTDSLRSGLAQLKHYPKKLFVFNININEIEIPPFKTFVKPPENRNVTQ